MNKFTQVIVTLCALVWLAIGLGIIIITTVFLLALFKGGAAGIIEQAMPLILESTQSRGGSGTLQSNGATLKNLPAGTEARAIEQKIKTPQFQSCAKQALGEEKLSSFMDDVGAGKMPSATEILRLMPCLR